MKCESIPGLHTRLAALAILFLAGGAHSSAQETISPLPEAQIREVTSRILQSAERADCKPQDCKIVVANFTLPSGLTSQLGIRLADQFSKEIASQQSEIQVIDRSALRAYLEQERIPGALLNNEKATRWLGKQVGGTAVLTGLIERKNTSLRAKIRLLSSDKEKARLEDELIFPTSDLMDGLSQIEAFPQKTPSINKPPAPEASMTGGGRGKDKATQPQCTYCPDPGYTKAGRDAKFNGVVLMQVALSEEGRVTEVKIVRGIPYGLNQEAIKTVRNWKLKPPTLNERPVATSMMIEINFRTF